MAAGVLTFTLGAEVSEFLHGIGLSSEKILSLGAAMEGIRAIAERTWKGMEGGAQLQDLSNRTGETVDNLYRMRAAFEESGLSADSVVPVIMRVQKALSGVGETGNNTTRLFARLGIQMDTLRNKSGSEQILAIAESLKKLPKNEATGVAFKIFGREGAGDILQITRDLDGYKASLTDAGKESAIFARTAELFKSIGDSIATLKRHIEGLFAGIAEAFAPEIKRVVDLLKSIDFTAMGEKIGEAVSIGFEAFHEGKIFELMSLTFEAGAEYLGNMIFGTIGQGGFWVGIFDVALGAFEGCVLSMAKLFMNLGLVLKSAIIVAFEVAAEAAGKIPGVGKALGLKGSKARKYSDVYAEQRENAKDANSGLDGLIQDSMDVTKMGVGEISDALKEAAKNAGGPAQDALAAAVSGFKAKLPPKTTPAAEVTKPEVGELSNGWKPEYTSLEKMGFVMSGVNNPNEYGRVTAEATQEIAANTREMTAGIKQLLDEKRNSEKGMDWSGGVNNPL